MLGFVAALHLGARPRLDGARFGAPPFYPAGILEAALAVILLISIVVPGRAGIRAGRVLIAQLLVIVGVLVGWVARMRAPMLATARDALVDGVLLALALASSALIAAAANRGGSAVHR